MFEHSTDNLGNVLGRTSPEETDRYLSAYAEDLADSDHPFAVYMRQIFRDKGITQQDVFLRAEIPQRYGYRLISQEKRTLQRDYILRICFAAKMSLKEINVALKLYGFSDLYARIPRDAVLIIAINSEIYDMSKVNDLLASHDFEPLKSCR